MNWNATRDERKGKKYQKQKSMQTILVQQIEFLIFLSSLNSQLLRWITRYNIFIFTNANNFSMMLKGKSLKGREKRDERITMKDKKCELDEILNEIEFCFLSKNFNISQRSSYCFSKQFHAQFCPEFGFNWTNKCWVDNLNTNLQIPIQFHLNANVFCGWIFVKSKWRSVSRRPSKWSSIVSAKPSSS